jgi:nitrite reductase/ring-hydroxylating ferredoxin subunit
VIAVCAAEDLVDSGHGVRFDLVFHGEKATGFVVRYEGHAYGYLNRCAHVAMELDWLPGLFFEDEGRYLMCATHGAIYEPRTGDCAGGPCLGRGGLLPLQVVERDGKVWWIPGAGMAPGVPPSSGAF